MSVRNIQAPTFRVAEHIGSQLSHGASIPLQPVPVPKTALSRLPTKTLVRSLLLTSLMTKPWIMRPSLAILSVLTKSDSLVLSPDRNPVLNQLLRWSIYDQFCAGTSRRDVRRTMAEMKRVGYQGIILGFAKEIVLSPSQGGAHANGVEYSPAFYQMIEEWKDEVLKTLQMIGSEDWLAVKVTGAGPIAVDAMKAGKPMPPAVQAALFEICEATQRQGSRLWIDAEQQALQPGLDEWVIELMRHFNRGQTLVTNTIQAYLKGARANADRHVALAAREGWNVGLKLVRGAYIEHEPRQLIHDTKEDTDRCYDGIAEMFINQTLPEAARGTTQFPASGLFLATHNQASAHKAFAAHSKRVEAGLPTTVLESGQVMGMADELSCELLDNYDKCVEAGTMDRKSIPKIFKFLTWGSVSECMGYLHRRAIENRGAVERTNNMTEALTKELWQRVFGRA